MIVLNLQNQIAADQWNVWICTGGWGIFENYSVEFYRGDKSGVIETTDLYIVWNHSTRGDFLK